MLNGIAPVLIFNIYERETAQAASQVSIQQNGIPQAEKPEDVERTLLAPIPFYFDEQISGILVESESKTIEVTTAIEAGRDSTDIQSFQKPVSSRVTIQLVASRNSIIVAAILSFFEQIYEKATAKEYTIHYISGGVTVFNGLISEFAVDQTTSDDLFRIRMTLEKGKNETTQQVGTLTIQDTSSVPLSQPLNGVGNLPDVPGAA